MTQKFPPVGNTEYQALCEGRGGEECLPIGLAHCVHSCLAYSENLLPSVLFLLYWVACLCHFKK
jgi:hypothetical protein